MRGPHGNRATFKFLNNFLDDQRRGPRVVSAAEDPLHRVQCQAEDERRSGEHDITGITDAANLLALTGGIKVVSSSLFQTSFPL